jgi:predicted dehydrogenase
MEVRPSGAAPLRAGVVGLGHLGSFHAKKYVQLGTEGLVDLRFLIDTKKEAFDSKGWPGSVRFSDRLEDMIGQVDVASVATPTLAHFEVAKTLLEHGIHVLIEKPVTKSIEEALELERLAKAKGLVVAIGHIERFNGAIVAVRDRVSGPRFIESLRLSPFQVRGTDVDVLMDLMIHDLDLLGLFVQEPLESLEAIGVPVLSQNIDIANVRLRFGSGLITQFTASRVSRERHRKMRIFTPDGYYSIDFLNQSVEIIERGRLETTHEIRAEQLLFPKTDALLAEIEDFLLAVLQKSPPRATIEDATRTLKLVQAVQTFLKDHPTFPV